MRNFIAYILILIAIIVTIPVGLALFEIWPMPLIAAIVFHIISAVVCGLGFYFAEHSSKIPSERGSLWCLYTFTFTLAMPVFGIITAVAVFFGQRWRTKRPPPIAADEITVQASHVFAPDAIRSRQLKILNLLDVEPLIDIFRTGETDLKIGAVKLLGQISTRRSIFTLMRALLDKDIEVRLFAAGTIGSIEDEYAQGIDRRKTALAANPGNRDIGIDLAKYYLSYAESGLLDYIANKFYYHAALETLSSLPVNDKVNYVKAQAHIALGEFKKALVCATHSIDENPQNGDYETVYWRILYQMKDYAMLQARIMDAQERDVKNTVAAVAEYWTS